MKCNKCDHDIDGNSLFCENCGNKIQNDEKNTFCANCGAKIKEGEVFCNNCGSLINKILKENRRNKKKNKKFAVVIVVLLLAAIVLAAAIFIGYIGVDKDDTELPEDMIELEQAEAEADLIQEPVQTEEPAVYEEEEAVYTQPPAEEPLKEEATKQPTPKPQSERPNYLFPSDREYITAARLSGLDKTEVALIRNEIYARHGYIFKTEPYKSYFESKKWYKPNPNFDEKMLNSVEKVNKSFIVQYETQMGWRS